MNMNKLTQKSIEAINRAQSIAASNSNTTVEQVHLLYALVSQNDGLIPALLKKLGADPNMVASDAMNAVNGLANQAGGAEACYASPQLGAALYALQIYFDLIFRKLYLLFHILLVIHKKELIYVEIQGKCQ